MRQSGVETGLVIALVADDVAKLDRFPTILNAVESRIEDRGMAVKLWIGRSIHRSCGPVNMLGPYHVPGGAVLVASVFAHARLHRLFHLGHRFAHRFAHGVEDAFIPAQFVSKTYRFESIEREVRQHPAVVFGPCRELFALRREVVAQAVIILLPHLTREL